MPQGNKIQVVSEGPYQVDGSVKLSGDDVETPIWLCRCGLSNNKPYCDGSHKEAGFTDPGQWVSKAEAAPDTDGELSINPALNGPLILSGPVTIVNGAGEDAFRGSKAALCRCGQSANKPFCDGTHSKSGFKSE